jgi:F0F1-type ATP synthase assembly protein I
MAMEKPSEEQTPRKADRNPKADKNPKADENPKAERIGIHENPKQSARFWRLAATMLGLIWNLVIPIVGGVLLGSYLGTRLGHSEAWMVGLLFVGVAVSFYNLYRFLFEEMSE